MPTDILAVKLVFSRLTHFKHLLVSIMLGNMWLIETE